MVYYKFEQEDVLFNQLRTHPQIRFTIYDKRVYRNNEQIEPGKFTSGVKHVPQGSISLYEINIDRDESSLVYPFITKDGSRGAFRNTSTSEFNSAFLFGDTITGSYPLSASLSRDHFTQGQSRKKIDALKNTMNYYKVYSPHYAFSSSLKNLNIDPVTMLSVPSIFYGKSIKKGTIDLKFYVTGTLIAQAKDEARNGELIQVGPQGSVGSGSVVGVALYNEGFLLLTGSQDLMSDNVDRYEPSGIVTTPKWIHFATTGSNYSIPSSSFDVYFEGTHEIPTLTMFTHAPKGQLNHSNNPTYLDKSEYVNPASGSYHYYESRNNEIKNIQKSLYSDVTGSFRKETYISKIGIYDENKNLIGIAKLATPVRKRETDAITFKLKMDF